MIKLSLYQECKASLILNLIQKTYQCKSSTLIEKKNHKTILMDKKCFIKLLSIHDKIS